MIYKFKINYRSLGGSSNESIPEQNQQAVSDNTNQENQENQDNTNQENQENQDNTNQENQPAYTSWADQYNEEELIEQIKDNIDLYRREFLRILEKKYYISNDDRNKIIETGIIPEKYQKEFEDNFGFFINYSRKDLQYPTKVRQMIADKPVSTESTVNSQIYKAPQPKDEAVSSKSTVKKYKAPQPKDEAVSSKSTTNSQNIYKAPQPKDEAVSSKSTSSIANDKKSISSENSVFDPDSKKSEELNKLLIQYHRMKLGDLSDDDINLLTNGLTQILNSDNIDRIRNECFIKEQNLIAKRDKLLNCKFQNFHVSSNNYQPNLWSDDLVNFINGYTHNQPGKPPIIFSDYVNIVNNPNAKGKERKQASSLATLAMKNAIRSYYENKLNELREECEEKIERLMNPISEKEFPTLSKALGKKK